MTTIDTYPQDISTQDTSTAPAPDSEKVKRIHFADGFTVDEQFFNAAIGWIQLRLRDVPSDRPYTVRQLAGKHYWSLLPDGNRKTTGRCVAEAVCRGLLPLEFVKGTHEYPLRYRIR